MLVLWGRKTHIEDLLLHGKPTVQCKWPLSALVPVSG